MIIFFFILVNESNAHVQFIYKRFYLDVTLKELSQKIIIINK